MPGNLKRVSHCYGERLEELDWENAYCDSVQMKINYKCELRVKN